MANSTYPVQISTLGNVSSLKLFNELLFRLFYLVKRGFVEYTVLYSNGMRIQIPVHIAIASAMKLIFPISPDQTP